MGTRERGQLTPLVALMIVIGGVGCIALARIAQAAVERAQAQTAADAAALAGAAEDEHEARDLAAANGGRLQKLERLDDDVRARVTLGKAGARARATRQGTDTVARWGEVAPAMRAALTRAEQLLGEPITVTERAPDGLAVALDGRTTDRLRPKAPEAGLCQADPTSRWFEVCPPPPGARSSP